jgi:hypothetical protein
MTRSIPLDAAIAEAEKSGFLSIEDLQRLASPQPANPAQVTDAVVEDVARAIIANPPTERQEETEDGWRVVRDYEVTARAALTAAIGAGGQAVADGAEEQELDRLRLQAFKTNSNDDKAAYYLAVSKWFQDRHYRALSQPHPADERVVEALREARELLAGPLVGVEWKRACHSFVAKADAALSATEGRKNG